MWWRLGGWCVSAPALLLGTEIREIGGGGLRQWAMPVRSVIVLGAAALGAMCVVAGAATVH